MRTGIAAVVVALVVGVGVWYRAVGQPETEGDNGAPTEEATPVTLGEVVHVRERTRLETVGTSRAVRSVTLHPASAGEVVSVDFSAGDRVDDGEQLLALDARDQRLALELAELRLADAVRLLERYTRAGPDSGAFTVREVDDARSAEAAARIARDRAAVALEDRTLDAPISGVIGFTDIDVGDRVTPETPIATLDDRSALLVRFEVPELFLGRLRVGDELRFAPWNDDGPAAEGSIEDVDTRVDEASRTFTARARLDNREDRWRPGMSFRVTLDLRGARYPWVPEMALQWGGEGAYVWAVTEDGRSRRVSAAVVQRRDGGVLVDADLPADSLVVIEGAPRLREDRRIDVIETGAPAAAPPIEAHVERRR